MSREDEVVSVADRIDGFFTEADMRLLYQTALDAIRKFPELSIVEIGSYKGRSTVVLGFAAKDSRDPEVRVYAVDPHEGTLTNRIVAPTFVTFIENVSSSGVGKCVIPVRERAECVRWSSQISLLFIDGLHTLKAVSSDYAHFYPFVETDGYVVFHDYGNPDFPDVKTFVDAKILDGEIVVHASLEEKRESTLIVTRKTHS